MKNKLQYCYSISVLIGVFVTAYMMMNRSVPDSFAERSQTPAFHMEAQAIDPAVSKLLEMEDVLRTLKNEEKEKEDKRLPADIRPSE